MNSLKFSPFAVLLVGLMLASSSPVSAAGFAKPVSYSSGGWRANSVAVGDVNGDGRPDVVVANSLQTGKLGTGEVGVLLGNGDGTFAFPVSYGSGGMVATSVAIADVNGDGKPDLVVTNECHAVGDCTDGIIGVLLGNGDGTFQSAVTYDSGGIIAVSVAIADVNGDGKPDLVVGNQCQSYNQYGQCNGQPGGVSVLQGNGNGTFQAAVSYESGGIVAAAVAAGDVNGDGHPDLVITNACQSDVGNCNSGVGVLLSNGKGAFQAPVFYNSGANYAISIAIGDVNGDGHPDLIVANSDTELGTVGVLLGNGNGTFQPAVIYDSGGTGASSVAISDLNGDGHPDLVVANACLSTTPFCNRLKPGGLGVLRGNGDGTFQTPIRYHSGGRGATSVVSADLRTNGKADLVVGNFCPSSGCDNGAVGVLLSK